MVVDVESERAGRGEGKGGTLRTWDSVRFLQGVVCLVNWSFGTRLYRLK